MSRDEPVDPSQIDFLAGYQKMGSGGGRRSPSNLSSSAAAPYSNDLSHPAVRPSAPPAYGTAATVATMPALGASAFVASPSARRPTSSSLSSPQGGNSTMQPQPHKVRRATVEMTVPLGENTTLLVPAAPGQDGAHGRGAPAEEEEPPLPKPWFGYVMFAGSLAGFGYTLYKTGGIAPMNVNPMIGPTPQVLIEAGAKVTSLIVGQKQYWRLLTPMWLHAGLIHLGTNMNMLYRLGFDLERNAGIARFSALYLLSGVASMVYSAVFTPQAVTVGASGALFGVLGALAGELMQNCHLLAARQRVLAFLSLFFSIALNLAVGLLPFVDNFAHFFGLISGMLLGFVLLLHKDRYGKLKCRQIVCACISAALWVAFVLLGVALLYYQIDANKFCPWCKYIDCVPAPWWDCDAGIVPTSTNNGTSNAY